MRGLGQAADGQAFVLQAGDCAESFVEFTRRRHPGQAEGHPADGRGPHLRRRGAGGQGGPHRRAVRQAPQLAHRDGRRPGDRLLPRAHGQRRPLRRATPVVPDPDAPRAPPTTSQWLDPQPAPGLHQGRLRRPQPGPRLEPAVRGLVCRGPSVRGHRRGHRPGPAVHGRLRHRPRPPRRHSTRSTSGPATKRSSSTTRRRSPGGTRSPATGTTARPHMLWVGERTRQLDGAHCEFLSGHPQPGGIARSGPTPRPDEVVGSVRAAQPGAGPRDGSP